MRTRSVDRQTARSFERRSGVSFEDHNVFRDGDLTLAAVIEASELGYWRHDVARDELDCSPRFKANLGLDADADLSSFTELLTHIHPEDRSPVAQAVEGAAASGTGFDIEHRVLTASGAIRWVRVRVRVFRRPDGSPLLAGVMFDLTEQKRVEAERERLVAELAAERARLHTLLEHLPAAVLMLDSSGKILLANPAVERIFPEAVSTTEISRLCETWQVSDSEGRPLSPDERPFLRALQGETISLEEIRLVRAQDGQTGWVRVSCAPVRDDAGAVSGAVLIGFDVDREKQTEEALCASESRARQLFDSPVIGILQSHRDGRVMGANDTFLRMLGYSRDDLCEGRVNWRTMTAPELRELDDAGLEQLLMTGSVRHYEKEYVRKDGSRIPVLIGSTRLAGSTTEHVTFVLDISDCKRAERERESLLRSLERSDERYRLAALATEDTIYDWDLRSDRCGVHTILGQRRAHAEHLPFRTDHVHPADRERLIAELQVTIERRDPLWQAEYRVAKGDGTWAIITDRGYVTYDAQGDAVRLVGAMRDVTTQRRQQEFERQLIGIVSHDLRNPLNTITLAADMLARSAAPGEHSQKNVLRIQRAGARAMGMIRDLLDFTKARLGTGIPLTRRPADLVAQFRTIVDDMRVGHPDRRIDFRSPTDLVGSFDPDRLAQVLTNLLENALRYSPPQTPVRVDLHADTNEGTLAVHNDGPPIPVELLPHIFEPLQRGQAAFDSTHRSVGLGLYIVKHLVEAHGGRITVHSTQAEGTEFRVTLPR